MQRIHGANVCTALELLLLAQDFSNLPGNDARWVPLWTHHRCFPHHGISHHHLSDVEVLILRHCIEAVSRQRRLLRLPGKWGSFWHLASVEGIGRLPRLWCRRCCARSKQCSAGRPPGQHAAPRRLAGELFVTRSVGGEDLGVARALCHNHLHTQGRPNKRLGHSHKSLRTPSAIL